MFPKKKKNVNNVPKYLNILLIFIDLKSDFHS